MNKNKKRNNFDEIASSINKTSFSTNILDKLNKTSIPFDSKYYYSIVNLSKKLPFTKIKFFNPSASLNNIFLNKNQYYKFIRTNSAFFLYNNNLNQINKAKREIENDSGKTNNSFLALNNNNINKEKENGTLNVKLQIMKQYLRKKKDKMNRTKFKFFRIVKNHGRKECHNFETKNQKFNEKLEHYFNSEYYYKINKIYHNNFHFGKNILNLGNDKTKQYISSIYPEQINKLNSDIVLKLLNDEDKKLIDSDPYFFFRENKKFYKLTKTKYRSLVNRLNEEEDKLPNKTKEYEEEDDLDIEKYYKRSKNKSSDKFDKKSENTLKIKKIKRIKYEIPFLNKKYVNRIINKDLNERLRNLKSRINPVEKQMVQTVGELNNCHKRNYIFEENKKFDKTYHIMTRGKYFKDYYLVKNRNRLIKETLFNQEINQRNYEHNITQDIIKKYQNQVVDYYSRMNPNKRYKT